MSFAPIQRSSSWADAVDDDSNDSFSSSGGSYIEDGVEEQVVSNPPEEAKRVSAAISFASILGPKPSPSPKPTNMGSRTHPSAWASRPALREEKKDTVEKPVVNVWNTQTATAPVLDASPTAENAPNAADPTPSADSVVENSTAFPGAKVVSGVSFLSKVLGNQTATKSTPDADVLGELNTDAPVAPRRANITRTTPADFGLESSRDGLNLLFSQVVKASMSTIVEEKALNTAPSAPIAGEPLTEQRVGKRQRQIEIGKMSTGYQNYCLAVPKAQRVPGEPTHPDTPDKYENVSKRSFDGKMRVWRRVLHLWDDVDVHTKPGISGAAQVATPSTATKKAKGKSATSSPMQIPGTHKRKAVKTPAGEKGPKKGAKILHTPNNQSTGLVR
jgi:hypothetical protein